MPRTPELLHVGNWLTRIGSHSSCNRAINIDLSPTKCWGSGGILNIKHLIKHITVFSKLSFIVANEPVDGTERFDLEPQCLTNIVRHLGCCALTDLRQYLRFLTSTKSVKVNMYDGLLMITLVTANHIYTEADMLKITYKASHEGQLEKLSVPLAPVSIASIMVHSRIRVRISASLSDFKLDLVFDLDRRSMSQKVPPILQVNKATRYMRYNLYSEANFVFKVTVPKHDFELASLAALAACPELRFRGKQELRLQIATEVTAGSHDISYSAIRLFEVTVGWKASCEACVHVPLPDGRWHTRSFQMGCFRANLVVFLLSLARCHPERRCQPCPTVHMITRGSILDAHFKGAEVWPSTDSGKTSPDALEEVQERRAECRAIQKAMHAGRQYSLRDELFGMCGNVLNIVERDLDL